MSTTREVAVNIARASLPFSAFRNESEWKDTIAFLTNAIDKALQAEREQAAQIAEAYLSDYRNNLSPSSVAAAIREGKPPE